MGIAHSHYELVDVVHHGHETAKASGKIAENTARTFFFPQCPGIVEIMRGVGSLPPSTTAPHSTLPKLSRVASHNYQ